MLKQQQTTDREDLERSGYTIDSFVGEAVGGGRMFNVQNPVGNTYLVNIMKMTQFLSRDWELAAVLAKNKSQFPECIGVQETPSKDKTLIFYNTSNTYSLRKVLDQSGQLKESLVNINLQSIVVAKQPGMNYYSVRLRDFGSAIKIENIHNQLKKQMVRNQYFAPEMQTRTHLSEKIDIFSLGVVLLQLSTGQIKIPSFSTDIQIREFLNEQASQNLKSFIQEMMNVDPIKRWSAKQLLEHPFISEHESGAKGWFRLKKNNEDEEEMFDELEDKLDDITQQQNNENEVDVNDDEYENGVIKKISKELINQEGKNIPERDLSSLLSVSFKKYHKQQEQQNMNIQIESERFSNQLPASELDEYIEDEQNSKSLKKSSSQSQSSQPIQQLPPQFPIGTQYQSMPSQYPYAQPQIQRQQPPQLPFNTQNQQFGSQFSSNQTIGNQYPPRLPIKMHTLEQARSDFKSILERHIAGQGWIQNVQPQFGPRMNQTVQIQRPGFKQSGLNPASQLQGNNVKMTVALNSLQSRLQSYNHPYSILNALATGLQTYNPSQTLNQTQTQNQSLTQNEQKPGGKLPPLRTKQDSPSQDRQFIEEPQIPFLEAKLNVEQSLKNAKPDQPVDIQIGTLRYTIPFSDEKLLNQNYQQQQQQQQFGSGIINQNNQQRLNLPTITNPTMMTQKTSTFNTLAQRLDQPIGGSAPISPIKNSNRNNTLSTIPSITSELESYKTYTEPVVSSNSLQSQQYLLNVSSNQYGSVNDERERQIISLKGPELERSKLETGFQLIRQKLAISSLSKMCSNFNNIANSLHIWDSKQIEYYLHRDIITDLTRAVIRVIRVLYIQKHRCADIQRRSMEYVNQWNVQSNQQQNHHHMKTIHSEEEITSILQEVEDKGKEQLKQLAQNYTSIIVKLIGDSTVIWKQPMSLIRRGESRGRDKLRDQFISLLDDGQGPYWGEFSLGGGEGIGLQYVLMCEECIDLLSAIVRSNEMSMLVIDMNQPYTWEDDGQYSILGIPKTCNKDTMRQLLLNTEPKLGDYGTRVSPAHWAPIVYGLHTEKVWAVQLPYQVAIDENTLHALSLIVEHLEPRAVARLVGVEFDADNKVIMSNPVQMSQTSSSQSSSALSSIALSSSVSNSKLDSSILFALLSLFGNCKDLNILIHVLQILLYMAVDGVLLCSQNQHPSSELSNDNQDDQNVYSQQPPQTTPYSQTQSRPNTENLSQANSTGLNENTNQNNINNLNYSYDYVSNNPNAFKDSYNSAAGDMKLLALLNDLTNALKRPWVLYKGQITNSQYTLSNNTLYNMEREYSRYHPEYEDLDDHEVQIQDPERNELFNSVVLNESDKFARMQVNEMSDLEFRKMMRYIQLAKRVRLIAAACLTLFNGGQPMRNTFVSNVYEALSQHILPKFILQAQHAIESPQWPIYKQSDMDVEQSLILSLIGNSSDQFKNQHKGNQTVEKEKEKEKGFNMEINQSNKTKEKEKEKERNKRSRINRRENTEYSDEDADDQSNQILGTDSVNNDDKEYQYQQIIGAYDAEIAIFALGHFMRNGQNHMYNSADELIQKVLYVVKLFSHEIPTLSGLAVALLTTLARTGMEHTRMAVINAVQNPTVPPIIKDVKEGARTGKIAGLWYSLAKELDTIVKKGC